MIMSQEAGEPVDSPRAQSPAHRSRRWLLMLGSGVVGGAVVGGVIGALTTKEGNAGIERLDPLPTAALSQFRETLYRIGLRRCWRRHAAAVCRLPASLSGTARGRAGAPSVLSLAIIDHQVSR